MGIKGIDVSKWQGNIDWYKVKNSGIDFAILREGYGRENPNQIDKKFEQNYKGAKEAGVKVGVYHYSYADGVNDAKKEAEFCLKNIKGKQFEYPICFDIEDSEMLVLSNRARTDIVKAFCETIENAGYYAMVYCNLNWLNNYLFKGEILGRFDLWLAQWSGSQPSESCGIWQFSESGKVNGVSGNVDLDVAYKNYPEIMKAKGLNGFSSNATPESKSNFVYTVKKGDTLTEIAQRYGVTISYLASKNNISNVNLIYPGQIIKI